jgi:zinc protease
MILDRTLIPGLKTPESISVIRASARRLDNGLSIYVINAGIEDVVKLDLIFPSGATGGSDYSIASACHQLIDTGTKDKKAIDIAEAFDYYGSYLQTDFGPDWKTISLYSLSRFFPETLSSLAEILQEANFPADELENWKTRSIQNLKVNREKVSWLAKTAFNEALYGKQHLYGFTPAEKDIESLSAIDLRDFFKMEYPLEKATVIVSGKVNEQVIKTLNDTIGMKTSGRHTVHNSLIPEGVKPASVKKIIEKKDAVQSGIRIGKTLFSKNHPDYPALQIVNTVLGGYFGSRLMSNIREDKGYTYGIGSGIHPHQNSGYFYISTEVGNEVREAAITEIYKELHRLAIEPVPEAELHLVKNYLIGAFQRSIDGPFALADRFRGLQLFNLGYEYLENYLLLLNTITPEMVMELAKTHLQPDSMTEVIAG